MLPRQAVPPNSCSPAACCPDSLKRALCETNDAVECLTACRHSANWPPVCAHLLNMLWGSWPKCSFCLATACVSRSNSSERPAQASRWATVIPCTNITRGVVTALQLHWPEVGYDQGVEARTLSSVDCSAPTSIGRLSLLSRDFILSRKPAKSFW